MREIYLPVWMTENEVKNTVGETEERLDLKDGKLMMSLKLSRGNPL